MPRAASDVRTLYDWLSRWRRWSLSRAEPDARLTMHRTLQVPADRLGEYGAPASPLVVDDLAFEATCLPPAPRVVDAGCGCGGTVFRWHDRAGGRYDGFTVSPYQQRVARREARRRGIAADCRFHVASYDEALEDHLGAGPGRDAVVSIEALAHSDALAPSVANLARLLAPGGRLVLVEDVATEALDPADPDVASFLDYWRIASLPTADDYARALAAGALELVTDLDLSAGFSPREPRLLDRLEARYRLVRRLLPQPLASIPEAYLGGLALERLYRRGLVRYRLVAGRR